MNAELPEGQAMTFRCTDNALFPLLVSALVFTAGTACRPRATGAHALQSAPNGEPLFCDKPGKGGEQPNEEQVWASAVARELMTCAQRNAFPESMSEAEMRAAGKLFDTFLNSGCTGCHFQPSSLGATGDIAANHAAGLQEFVKALAIRHHGTRKIIETCFVDSPGRAKLIARLAKRRHASEGGLTYKLRRKEFTTIAGIPFFTLDTELGMRSQVLSFMQGNFEIAAAPGDELHEHLLGFIAAGGHVDLKSQVCVIRDALISVGKPQAILKSPAP